MPNTTPLAPAKRDVLIHVYRTHTIHELRKHIDSADDLGLRWTLVTMPTWEEGFNYSLRVYARIEGEG